MGRLAVGLMGPFALRWDGRLIPNTGLRAKAVLAQLALRPGRPVSTADLIDGIWGDEPPDTVTNVIQVYVAQWRRRFADAECDVAITREPSGYVLHVEDADVDASRFLHLADVSRDAMRDGRPAVAVHATREALGLVRGDPLQDFAGLPFHHGAQVRLDNAHVQIAGDRADALLALGQGGELVADLQTIVARHPLHERFRAQLMHALYRSGRHVEAMRAFDDARAALVEVGMEPGAALREMEQAVLRQDPTLESRVSPFAPSGPPVPFTSLIGREADVDRVVALIRETKERLFTLTGPGGVGKSRLGIQVATRIVEEGWSPVAYAALADVSDPAVVTMAVNAAFGVPDTWRERPVGDIARMLGDSPVLLVIDGAEHLVDAVRDVVRIVLERGPQLRALVTSRVPLGLAGERRVPVSPLSARVSSGPAELAPAVALFLDRRERTGEPIEFTSAEIDSIIGICERVDGLPLAIELAAARSGTLGVTGLLERLGARLDLLATPGRSGDDRHGSLRRVIEWSHGLLDAQSQRLLARLSVFAGGFTLAHVEEMWSDEDAGQLLGSVEELRRNSLMTRMPGAAQRRFRLLDTVGEFARERLVASGEGRDTHERLVTWIREKVGASGGRVGAGAVQFAALEPDVDNARGAVQWLLDDGHADQAADLCTRIYVWWMYGGRRSEMKAWLTRLATLAVSDRRVRAEVLQQLGHIEAQEAHAVASDRYLTEAVGILREIGDRAGLASGLATMAETAAYRQDVAASESLLAEAAAAGAGIDDRQVRCRILAAQLALEINRESYDAALAVGGQLLDEAVESGWSDLESKVLGHLGQVHRALAHHEVASDLLDRAVAVAEGAANRDALEFALSQHALTAAAGGRPDRALPFAHRCLTCLDDTPSDPWAVLRSSAAVALSVAEDDPLCAMAIEVARTVIAAFDEVVITEAERRIAPRLGDIGAAPPPRPSTEVDVVVLTKHLVEALARRLSEPEDDFR